jgi:hypothetical protein
MHGGKSTGRPPTHGQRTLKAKLQKHEIKELFLWFSLINQAHEAQE